MCMYIYTSLSLYNMQNCYWNPQHIRSTMHMRIQGVFWCLVAISFFEVIYEGKNFMHLQDQSYLSALEWLRNIITTGRLITNQWMLKELQEANIQRFSKGLASLSSLCKGQILVFCWCISKCCINEPCNFCVLPHYREMFSHWFDNGKAAVERSGR